MPFGSGQGPGTPAGGDLTEQIDTIELLEQRNELADRREQLPRRRRSSELLGQQRDLDETEPESARLLANAERRPPEIEHRPPQVGTVAVALDDTPHEARRARTRQHRTDVVAQRLLIVRQFEIHPTSPRVDTLT